MMIYDDRSMTLALLYKWKNPEPFMLPLRVKSTRKPLQSYLIFSLGLQDFKKSMEKANTAMDAYKNFLESVRF